MCHLNHDPISPRRNRRDVLRGSLAGALAMVGLSAQGTAVVAANLVEADTPSVTEGPYWVDGMLNRSDVRNDPTSGVVQAGLPLALAVNVSELNADGSVTPVPGAFLDIWPCNVPGIYSDIAAANSTGQQYLRGIRVTNAHGNVKFTTIFLGRYSGRTPHIHARVRVYDAATDTMIYNFATQFFFDDATTEDVYQNVVPYSTRTIQDTLSGVDTVYSRVSNDASPTANAGQYLLVSLAENRTKATASFNIMIDPTNTANEDTGVGAPTRGGGGGTPPTGGAGGGTPPTGGPGGGSPPTGGPGASPPSSLSASISGFERAPVAAVPVLASGGIPARASIL